MKKTLALTLSALLILLLVACAPAATSEDPDPGTEAAPAEAAESETVHLLNYYIGDGAKDNDEVFAAANALSEEKLGITVTNQYISWSDYTTKYPLVFASGEDFDLIFTANWSFYAQ